MNLTDEFKAELKQYSVDFQEADHVEKAIADADVILVEPAR
jgi:aspartate carbamoyltransferase catalytic subunit